MNSVTLCYALAAAAFVGLSFLLLTGWRGRQLLKRLLLATSITAVWAITVCLAAQESPPVLQWIFWTEILRDAAWLNLLLLLARGAVSRRISFAVHATWIGILAASLVWPWLLEKNWVTRSPQFLLSCGGLVLALIALALLEQIYRNASAAAQKTLRFFVLGVGSLFAYDLFLYSQAELLKGIDRDAWTVRGIIVALAAPLIAVSVKRNKEWLLDLFVSRQVVFYSTAFVAAGSYLLLMAVGGYYVRSMGGTWGGIAQIFFFSGAALVLMAVMFSSMMRRRLMVFISKHFYRNKYDYRIEWLRFIETLSLRADNDIRQTSVRAVAQILASPGGVLFTLDDAGNRFTPSACWPKQIATDIDVAPLKADHELVRFLEERQWIVDLEEYRRTPDRYQNILMPEWLTVTCGLRLISPVLELNRLVGFILLQAPPSPFELTYEDRDLLKTMGRQVATYLSQQDAHRKLAESHQFEAYSRLTAFMMHDLKNSVAQLSLLVANAARHKHNPEFIEDAIGTIGNATDRMTRLMEQLQRGTSLQAGRRTALRAIIQRAINRCAARMPIPTAQLPSEEVFVIADPERLEMVMEHIVRNAQDACSPKDSVSISLAATPSRATIAVEDTGAGMDANFLRDRLFKPFDSTKGSKGMGIGAYQTREYVRSLGGDVRVDSTVGRGTRFAIELPIVVNKDLANKVAADTQTEGQSETWSDAITQPDGHSKILPAEG